MLDQGFPFRMGPCELQPIKVVEGVDVGGSGGEVIRKWRNRPVDYVVVGYFRRSSRRWRRTLGARSWRGGLVGMHSTTVIGDAIAMVYPMTYGATYVVLWQGEGLVSMCVVKMLDTVLCSSEKFPALWMEAGMAALFYRRNGAGSLIVGQGRGGGAYGEGRRRSLDVTLSYGDLSWGAASPSYAAWERGFD